jgi:ferritin-like protein
MRKILITLGMFMSMAVLSANADCEIKFQDDNTDIRSTIVVAIKKCAVLAAEHNNCATKQGNKDSNTYRLNHDILCTQLDANGKKLQSFVVFQESENEDTSVIVNSDESFKLSKGISYKLLKK